MRESYERYLNVDFIAKNNKTYWAIELKSDKGL